jgi:hypothetical protein
MSDRARAPRFQAYIEHGQGRTVLTMPREEWESLKPDLELGGPTITKVDISATPLQGVVRDASVIAGVISQSTTGAEPQIEIYRHDPNDEPTPINKDVYTVWENITRHVDYETAVVKASTSNDANLQAYLAQNVFIVKDRPGQDHWLSNLPAEVSVFVQST